MRRVRRACAAVLALALVGCAPPPSGDDAGAVADGGPLPDGGAAEVDALPLLDDEEDHAALADASGAVKHLLPVEGHAPVAPVGDACVFQDTARFPFHLQYLNAQPGGEEVDLDTYVELVLRRETRAWWGGELVWRPAREHPLTGSAGTMLFTLYTEDSVGNRLVVDDVRAVHALLVVHAPAFADALAFTPSSIEQRQTAQAAAATLAGEGIAVVLDPG